MEQLPFSTPVPGEVAPGYISGKFTSRRVERVYNVRSECTLRKYIAEQKDIIPS